MRAHGYAIKYLWFWSPVIRQKILEEPNVDNMTAPTPKKIPILLFNEKKMPGTLSQTIGRML
jgi:hypothetical protein